MKRIEQWFLKIETAVAKLHVVHVQLMRDGTVIEIGRWEDIGGFLAGREVVDQIMQIISHVRAGRFEPISRPSISLDELLAVMDDVDALKTMIRERQAVAAQEAALQAAPTPRP